MYQVMEICPKCNNHKTQIIHGRNKDVGEMYNFCSICKCEWNYISYTTTTTWDTNTTTIWRG